MQFKLLVSFLLASAAVAAPIQQERGLGDMLSGLGDLGGLRETLGQGGSVTGSGNEGQSLTIHSAAVERN